MGTAVTGTIRHGTTSGWAAHVYRGETPCADCYHAKSKYDKDRLEANPEAKRKNRLRARAQGRAEGWLRAMYPEAWQALYEKALREVFEKEGGE